MLRLDISSAEFLGSNGPERAEKCRQFASVAEGLAANATDVEKRDAYLNLVREWHKLADEIERVETERTAKRATR